jgi:hypothetical protein
VGSGGGGVGEHEASGLEAAIGDIGQFCAESSVAVTSSEGETEPQENRNKRLQN